MRYIIRTIEKETGKRLPLKQVNEKRLAAKTHVLETGLQYLETESMLGSFNAMGQRIEEQVYIIEDVQEMNYV